MPTFKSFADFGNEMEKMAREIDVEARTIVAREMAMRAQSIAKGAADGAIGGSFSGWKRGAPIELVTQIKSIKNGMAVIPTKVSAGPWTVVEQGRHSGNASGFSGPGINRKTGLTSRTKSGGLRKVRATKGKRWNGATHGFHAASDAVAKMEYELPPIANRGVHKIMVRHFDVT